LSRISFSSDDAQRIKTTRTPWPLAGASNVSSAVRRASAARLSEWTVLAVRPFILSFLSQATALVVSSRLAFHTPNVFLIDSSTYSFVNWFCKFPTGTVLICSLTAASFLASPSYWLGTVHLFLQIRQVCHFPAFVSARRVFVSSADSHGPRPPRNRVSTASALRSGARLSAWAVW
jgi:hypothetical protein